MKRTLAFMLAMAAPLMGFAEPPQPTAQTVERAKELFASLQSRDISNAQRAETLMLYFGQLFEMRDDLAYPDQVDFYLIRRDPKSGLITFMQRVGTGAK